MHPVAQSFEADGVTSGNLQDARDFRLRKAEVRKGCFAASSDVMPSQIQPSEFFLMT